MYVIGTAGHVDHGKSTLVKALTDIDPDRLPEEKEREMTVDLGFAWMTLPSGREVSIVDVPGHERFIKNMLAGVGAIDLALLIVAADESVMPQTREHLAILDLLRIRRGLVVVTKSDLVDDELVELVMAEVEDALDGTAFRGCPMLPVSAYTGAGLDALKAAIDGILDDTEARRDLGRPRLPIDRSFTVSGFGTVVTGTLIDGSVAVGQQVELAPSGVRARIRGLQSHKARLDASAPGVRLALNLSGVSRDEVMRGEVLTNPGWLRPTRRFDAHLRMVRGAPHALKHNEGVTFHLFTSETTGRVRLLDADRLSPGGEGWVQVLLDDAVPMVKGDFFVLRSSEDTLGGGQVADPNPRRRHRRFAAEVLERLTMLDAGADEDIILTLADQLGPCDRRTLSQRSNLSETEVADRLAELAAQDAIVTFHLFTSETTGRVRLLDADRLSPGGEGWVQVLLDDAVPMVKGDFFVLRSSEDTLGGGQVADPNPRRRHRRFAAEVLERLTMLDAGADEDIILTLADQLGPCDRRTLSQRSNLSETEVADRLAELAAQDAIVALGEIGAQSDAVVYSRRGWDIVRNQAQVALQTYHNQYPLRRGAPPQELRSRLNLPQAVYVRVAGRLAAEGVAVDDGGLLRAPDHQVTLTAAQEAASADYLAALAAEPWSPPTDRHPEPELLGYLQSRGDVVRVNDTVVFTAAAYADLAARIVGHLEANGSVTVADARDLFNASRKYVLPLLEYLDQQRITRRVGDERVLR